MDKCNHHYSIPQAGKIFCLTCKQYVEIVEEAPQELVMPPHIFEITENLWTKIAPWKSIPYALVKKNLWYLSIINSQEYLVMPVMRMGNPVYFSARKLGKGTGLKYLYPTGVKKLPWVSSDKLEQEPIIICEGVADAVYCSFLSSSVAILGSYYDGSLDDLLHNRNVSLCLDGDSAGILGALKIARQLQGHTKETRICSLPVGCDPTDIPFAELDMLIRGECRD